MPKKPVRMTREKKSGGIGGWVGRHMLLSALTFGVAMIVIIGAIAGNAPPAKPVAVATAIPTTVAQLAATAVPTVGIPIHFSIPKQVVKHKPTKTATATITPVPTKKPKPTKVPSATRTPRPSKTPTATTTPVDTDTPIPTATSAPTAIPTATVGPKVQERVDFRDFYGHFAGIENLCTNAANAASTALAAAQKDSSLSFDAYQAAETAHSDCDTAATDMAVISEPDSLSSFKIDDMKLASFTRMGAIRDEWYDVAQALNDGNVTFSDQATLQGHISDASSALDEEAADLAVIGLTLNIKLTNIVPIPPGG